MLRRKGCSSKRPKTRKTRHSKSLDLCCLALGFVSIPRQSRGGLPVMLADQLMLLFPMPCKQTLMGFREIGAFAACAGLSRPAFPTIFALRAFRRMRANGC